MGNMFRWFGDNGYEGDVGWCIEIVYLQDQRIKKYITKSDYGIRCVKNGMTENWTPNNNKSQRMILYTKAQINTREKAGSIYMPKQFKWETNIPTDRSTKQKANGRFGLMICSFYVYASSIF